MRAIIAAPVTLAMIYRAWSHNSLTPAGIIAATFTAIAHAYHPWNLPFALLIVFFLAGTRVTKVKHNVKATLTMQSTGNAGGEGARTHVQVLANSAVASVLTLLHAYQLHRREEKHLLSTEKCFSLPGDLLVVGIIANYAAVAADTFSSELGILSKSKPRLITSLSLREVPPGTNGGVTMAGSLAGLLGSLVLVTTSMALVPWCDPALSNGWSFKERQRFTYAMTIWGALGSLLDSFLGGWLQQSVVDTRTGRIVEGEGGKTVLVSKRGPSSMHYNVKAEVKSQLLSGQGKDSINVQAVGHNDTNEQNQVESKNDISQEKDRALHFGDNKPSRVVESGSLGLLDNNEVNFLMALTMSLGAMGIGGWIWGTPMSSIFQA